ncbi:MAG: hypothetical protein A3J74_07005 [Elusimicrobia bacterium RIFCSPHIGHO2_02_FULL_57_9]|nr:MAG: hypothetical protein A3J74_07005 [Elusimicrobia bacterium RIFCSPHIGHO2_02_FULL_57_9]
MRSILSVFLLGLLCAQEPAAQEWDARITDVRGEVTVLPADGDAQGVEAEKDMPLASGDRIATGTDAGAEISLEGDHVIYLRANSDFTLQSARHSDSIFNLTLGSLLAKLQKLGEGRQLKVRTPTAVAAVRGTEFGVEISPENPDETYVGVFDEGKVAVSDESGHEEILGSNQEIQVLRGQRAAMPYQLKRFVRHRRFVRSLDRRMLALRKTWKPLPAAQRLERRLEILQRLRQRRQELRQKMREKRNRPDKRRPADLRPDQKKMEKFREEIRKRRRQGQ